jgi:cation-transporting P-type ATPase 13A2
LPIAIFMGWAGPFQRLAPKRPTASLVSRKVLTPLLGQISLCVVVQLLAFKSVQTMPWYQPPILDKDHSNTENSQNTALFLLSCYQYILSAIILSVGPPFRQPMTRNMPFVVTMFTAVFISSYLLLDPAKWLTQLMELTFMSPSFKTFLLMLALVGFAVGYLGENWIFPRLAKWIGVTKKSLLKREKKRKEYKIILEDSVR